MCRMVKLSSTLLLVGSQRMCIFVQHTAPMMEQYANKACVSPNMPVIKLDLNMESPEWLTSQNWSINSLSLT